MKSLLTLMISCLLATLSCKKSTPIDSRNRDLKNIPLTELKSILAGTWLMKKKIDCGFAGCFTTNLPIGQEDIFSFLPEDSVKRVRGTDGAVMVYQKAVISKSTYDNSWYYEMRGGLEIWPIQELKNDTLLIGEYGFGEYGFLIRKR